MLALCRVGGWGIVSYVSAQFVTAQNKHQSYAFFFLTDYVYICDLHFFLPSYSIVYIHNECVSL